MFARLRPGRTSVSDTQNDLNTIGAADAAPTDTFPIGENDNTSSVRFLSVSIVKKHIELIEV